MAELAKKEGRKLKTLSPMAKVSPYIMVNRNGATNQIHDTICTDTLDEYIRRKKAEGLTGFNIMHIFVAAYVRVVSQRPGINRFLRGQRVYARNGIEVVIVAKKEMRLDADDTCIKIPLSPSDTAEDVYKAFETAIEGYRQKPAGAFDSCAKVLNYIPGLLMKFAIWFLKLLDYFGWLPRFLTRLSPFHGSLFITSMGSLGIPVIFHHLYDFGNLPIFLAFGAKYRKYEPDAAGEIHEKHYVDYSLVTDERICDGFYYASAIKLFKSILRHPEKLDQAPEHIENDIR